MSLLVLVLLGQRDRSLGRDIIFFSFFLLRLALLPPKPIAVPASFRHYASHVRFGDLSYDTLKPRLDS